MIIECSQCSAKFRFDDTLMRGEGVWVRCGHCRYEFFQGPPVETPAAAPVAPPEAPEPEPRDGDVGEDRFEAEGADQEPLIVDDREAQEEAEAVADIATKRRGPARIKMLAGVLALLVVLAGVVFMAFPELVDQTVSEWSAYLPWMKKEPPPRPAVGEGIRIEGVRQRYVPNLYAGNLRIIEGVAVNETGQGLSRLQMKATLTDAQSNWLGEKRAYAGHVLSDAELTALNAEEMNRRLATPEGSTTPNDRIMAGGRVPFMIVWAAEPPGAVKTFVAVAAVERLP